MKVAHWLHDVAAYVLHLLQLTLHYLLIYPVRETDHFYHRMAVVVAPITWVFGLAALYYTLREIGQSWLLLARSLPRHGRMPRSVQAITILVPNVGRGVQLLSLYDAARWRIEIELLRPFPEHSFDFASRQSHRGVIERFRAAKGRWTETRNWTKETNDLLSALVRQDPDKRIVDIDDCSRVIDNDDVVKYFKALTRFRRSPQPSFLLRVAFRFGFVAPLHLVTGVLARYEDEWGPVIASYGRSLIRPDDKFRYSPTREFQSFIFDCWMIWGPSIPICTCPEWHGEVALQYGFGDEDNSLILRCPSPQILRSLDEQNPAIPQRKGGSSSWKTREPEENPIARRVRVSGVLKWGPALHDDAFCSAQHAIWHDKRLVLDISAGSPAESIRIAGGTEEQVYARYYSAYLWIAFVMCEQDDNAKDGFRPYHGEHRWRDLIPFFTHANIASAETYRFYRDQLAHSALEGVLQILRDERKPVLRFACAVDESGCGYDLLYPPPADTTIREKMVHLVGHLREHGDADTKELLKRLRIGAGEDPLRSFMEGDYSACALPGIVNDYFDEVGTDDLLCHELRGSLRSDRHLLKKFYEDCLVSEIPDQNARDSLSHIEENLRLKDTDAYAKEKNNYHVVVALEGDKLIGGAIATYLFQSNAGVIEYLIVQPDHRREGVGRRLLEFTESLLHEDADKMRRILGVDAAGDIDDLSSGGANKQFMHEVVKRHNTLDWIVAELQDPYRTPVLSNQFDPFGRAHIWRKWGYELLDYPYVQPALDTKRRPVTNLMLMAKPCEISRFRLPADVATDVANVDARKFEIPMAEVDKLVKAYIKVSMPDAPEDADSTSPDAEAKRRVPLLGVDRYLGWQEGLHAKEVLNARDPALDDGIAAYTSAFAGDAPNVPGIKFREAFQPGGLARRPNYRYHLWALYKAVTDTKCIGMASFVTMPTAGFANYVGFVESAGRLPVFEQLVARIEEQMMRDRRVDETQSSGRKDDARHRNWLHLLFFRMWCWLRSLADPVKKSVSYMRSQLIRLEVMPEPDTDALRSEWFVECPNDVSREALRTLYPDLRRKGFYELDVQYRRPSADATDEERNVEIPLLYKQIGRTYGHGKPSIPIQRFLDVVGEIYASVYADVPPAARQTALDELARSLDGAVTVTSLDDERGPTDPPRSVPDQGEPANV